MQLSMMKQSEKTMGERIRDRTIAQILCVNDLIKPLQLEHWTAMRSTVMSAVGEMFKQLQAEWNASNPNGNGNSVDTR